MFCSCSLNGLSNEIHERALRLIGNDRISSFEDILEISYAKTIHQQNFEFLAKAIYKFLNVLSPHIMSDFLTMPENLYNLPDSRFYIRLIKGL